MVMENRGVIVMRSLIGALAISLSGGVMAQSSVTLYGVVATNILFTNNAQTSRASDGTVVGGRQTSVGDGLASGFRGSRWGLRGTEDIGGGLAAVFELESGFLTTTGSMTQGGLLFGRQAYVGLKSNEYGTVTVGRQYDSTIDYVSGLLSLFQDTGVIGTHPGNGDGMLNLRRINQSIKFTTKVYRGFQAGALYGFGGVAGQFGRNSIFSLGARYKSGSVSLGVGYLDAKNPNISYFGTNGNSGGVTSNNIGQPGSLHSPQTAPVISGFSSASSLRELAVATQYVIGRERIGAGYTRTVFSGLGDTAESGPDPLNYNGKAIVSNAEVSWQHQFSIVRTAVAYDYEWVTGVGGHAGAHYQQVSGAIHYPLSKRTDLYALAAYQAAAGTNSLGEPAVAQIGLISASSTNRQVAFSLGIMHQF